MAPQQRAQFYRAFFDRELSDALGHETLEYIDHKGVAAFVADTSIREGQPGFGMVQQAINTVRKEQGLPTVAENTIFDGDTLDALNQVTETLEGRRLFAKTLKKDRDIKRPGEQWRTNNFNKLTVR